MTNAPLTSDCETETDLDKLKKDVARLNRRFLRERRARKQAEKLLEERAFMLFETNERLEKLNNELEQRVISRTKELEQARTHAIALSEHDQLTGLANRRSFLKRLNRTLDHTKLTDQSVALLAIDIDHFKDINDTFGHPAGDALLIHVANRLSELVHSSGLVARLGGDEFAILFELKQETDEVAFIADKIIDALDEPFFFEGKSLEVSCSVGATISDPKNNNAEDLQRFADIALYHTKQRGRGDWALYQDSMSEGVRQRKKLSHHLRQALEQDAEGLEVHYQPIIDISTGIIVAAEALCRWTDPELGSISPEIFIPVAEETSLIYELGDYILKRSCSELRDWLSTNDAHLSINLSPKQLKDRNLYSRVQSALNANNIDPSRLCLEVTESLFLWNIKEAQNKLNELSSLGVLIALDDFGTGFSNLNQLRLLPIDFLKIDRAFINDIEQDPRALAMVRAILEVTRGMHITAVAEGVENQEQANLLRQVGGGLVQGYFFSKALPIEDFLTYAQEATITAHRGFSYAI